MRTAIPRHIKPDGKTKDFQVKKARERDENLEDKEHLADFIFVLNPLRLC